MWTREQLEALPDDELAALRERVGVEDPLERMRRVEPVKFERLERAALATLRRREDLRAEERREDVRFIRRAHRQMRWPLSDAEKQRRAAEQAVADPWGWNRAGLFSREA